MKTTYIADTISLSPAYAAFRHDRHFEHAVYGVIVAAGVAVVSMSVAALGDQSANGSVFVLDETGRAAPAVTALADESETGAALHALGRSCIGGDAVSCNDLGVSLLQGYDGAADVSAAARAFERSCFAGSPDGCGNLGALYESGAGVSADIARARELYAHACSLGGALACSNLGALYAQGRGVERDLDEARRLFARACETGSATGCDNVLRIAEARF